MDNNNEIRQLMMPVRPYFAVFNDNDNAGKFQHIRVDLFALCHVNNGHDEPIKTISFGHDGGYFGFNEEVPGFVGIFDEEHLHNYPLSQDEE